MALNKYTAYLYRSTLKSAQCT